jgi:hypothetical protein
LKDVRISATGSQKTIVEKKEYEMFVGLYFDAKKEDTRKRRLEKLIGLVEENKKPM